MSINEERLTQEERGFVKGEHIPIQVKFSEKGKASDDKTFCYSPTGKIKEVTYCKGNQESNSQGQEGRDGIS